MGISEVPGTSEQDAEELSLAVDPADLQQSAQCSLPEHPKLSFSKAWPREKCRGNPLCLVPLADRPKYLRDEGVISLSGSIVLGEEAMVLK